jgi:hypothetical protein
LTAENFPTVLSETTHLEESLKRVALTVRQQRKRQERGESPMEHRRPDRSHRPSRPSFSRPRDGQELARNVGRVIHAQPDRHDEQDASRRFQRETPEVHGSHHVHLENIQKQAKKQKKKTKTKKNKATNQAKT